MNCPSCEKEVEKLVTGVCERCKRNFEAAHKASLTVDWKPGDFEYPITIKDVAASPPMIEPDDSESQMLHEVRVKANDFHKRAFREFISYKGDYPLTVHAFCIANGWGEIVSCETAVEVAVKLYKDPKKKAAVSKAVKYFQDILGIPPMPGQRSQEGRESMKRARKGQLK